MRGTSLVWLGVASGCIAGTAEPPRSLRVEPAGINLDVDLGQPAPTVALRVFAVGAGGSEDDVTLAATVTLDGAPLGALAAGSLTSDGVTGGAATLHVAYQRTAAAVPVTAHVHGRRVVDGTPPGASDAFTTATAMPFDAHLDPGDGAVLPPGLGRIVLAFAAPDVDDAHRIVVTAPYLDLEIVAPGVAGPREVELSASEWAAISHTARGGALQLDLASLSSRAPATAHVTSIGLEIADLDPSALVAGGTTSDPTDAAPIRPSLWRYDMHVGGIAQMFANPAGACIGCHLAVSADGTRIAALIVSPTAPRLNGVLLDRGGTVLAQSDAASAAPWATAAFDPGGALVTAWQGKLALRDATTGAALATIAMTDTAAAPTISPDGKALAYVALDAGPGDAASQPAGNALHVRPWNAAAAAVGTPVELVRDGRGVVLPMFSSDGRWIAYGHAAIDPDRINEVPLGSAAVRADGSGTTVELTADPLDKLAHWASPVAAARVGNRPPEPMVWVAVVSGRPVGGAASSLPQLWLEAFYPERGVVARPFHLPGQPALLHILHGPIALP